MGLALPSFRQGISQLRPKQVLDWRHERRLEALSSFRAFLRHWWFVNRETGNPIRFVEETMWRGQTELATLFEEEPWVFALKAGKLGFTQLETAFDAYRLLTVANSRVHLFSMNLKAAKDLLGYVRYGLTRLPDWFEVHIREDLAEGDNQESIKISVGADLTDIRRVVSYAGGDNVSIDQSCVHAHVDEMARMLHPEATWAAVQSTVAPDVGTCHIVTRGQGESDFIEMLWEQSAPGRASDLVGRASGTVQRSGRLIGYFAPYDYRSGRDDLWRETEAATMTPQQLAWWAPADPTDAFAGDEMQTFVPIAWWDALYEEELKNNPILPGDPTPLVLGLDAAVTGDCFALIAVSRHPDPARWETTIAVRGVNIWRPRDFPGGRIDFDYIERFLRVVCKGGCQGFVDAHGLLQQHPHSALQPEICDACANERFVLPFNITCVCYDPAEMEQMSQRLQRDRVVWMYAFDQGNPRLESDKGLYDLIVWRRLGHGGSPQLREHIDNAKSKVPKDDDKKLRLIKKSPARKIDGAVALAMAAKQCLHLNMPRAA